MLGERKRVVSERGAQLKLEDGTAVAKSHENKTWRWLSDEDDEVCGVDADVDGRLGAGGPTMTGVPEESRCSLPSTPASKSEPQSAIAHESDATVLSIDELLAAIERD